jgi:hypothetical protein
MFALRLGLWHLYSRVSLSISHCIPRLQRNLHSPFYVNRSGLGVFEDNDIFQNGYVWLDNHQVLPISPHALYPRTYGLETTTKGAPEMKDCELHGNW